MARTANMDRLRDEAIKVRNRTAKQLFNAQTEAIAANAQIERGQARLLKAGELVDLLTPAHAQNNAAVVALGGEAADYTPPEPDHSNAPVSTGEDGPEATGDAPAETNPDAETLESDKTPEPVAEPESTDEKPRRVRRGQL